MSLDNVLPMSLESFVTYVPERFTGFVKYPETTGHWLMYHLP